MYKVFGKFRNFYYIHILDIEFILYKNLINIDKMTIDFSILYIIFFYSQNLIVKLTKINVSYLKPTLDFNKLN